MYKRQVQFRTFFPLRRLALKCAYPLPTLYDIKGALSSLLILLFFFVQIKSNITRSHRDSNSRTNNRALVYYHQVVFIREAISRKNVPPARPSAGAPGTPPQQVKRGGGWLRRNGAVLDALFGPSVLLHSVLAGAARAQPRIFTNSSLDCFFLLPSLVPTLERGRCMI